MPLLTENELANPLQAQSAPPGLPPRFSWATDLQSTSKAHLWPFSHPAPQDGGSCSYQRLAALSRGGRECGQGRTLLCVLCISRIVQSSCLHCEGNQLKCILDSAQVIESAQRSDLCGWAGGCEGGVGCLVEAGSPTVAAQAFQLK